MDFRRTSSPLATADKLSVVPVADAMAQMRVSASTENTFVSGLVCDAYDWFAAETGWLGHCCLLNETFQAYFPAGGHHRASGFDRSRPRRRSLSVLELPMRPVLTPSAIAAVEVLQSDGTYAALDPTLYTLRFDADTMIAAIAQVSTYQAWPRFAVETDGAFRVTFTAGFGPSTANADPAAATAVPGPICRAIKLLAATMYNQRESTADAVAQEVMYGIRALAGRYRIEPDHS